MEGGYSNESLYPEKVNSVYVEMFDNRSFRRGIEYELSDAVAKRIELHSPYKIVTDRNTADTVISGYLQQVEERTLTVERQTGRALEQEVVLAAIVTWKDLNTGQFLIEREEVAGSASFSRWQGQSFDYGSALAANNLARRIVELMEKEW